METINTTLDRWEQIKLRGMAIGGALVFTVQLLAASLITCLVMAGIAALIINI